MNNNSPRKIEFKENDLPLTIILPRGVAVYIGNEEDDFEKGKKEIKISQEEINNRSTKPFIPPNQK